MSYVKKSGSRQHQDIFYMRDNLDVPFSLKQGLRKGHREKFTYYGKKAGC